MFGCSCTENSMDSMDEPNGWFVQWHFTKHAVHEYHQEHSPVTFRRTIPFYPSRYPTALPTSRGDFCQYSASSGPYRYIGLGMRSLNPRWYDNILCYADYCVPYVAWCLVSTTHIHTKHDMSCWPEVWQSYSVERERGAEARKSLI